MRSMLPRFTAPALMALVGLVACRDAPASDAAAQLAGANEAQRAADLFPALPRAARPSAGPLQITLASSPARLEPGDTLRLRAVVRNTSDRAVTLSFPRPCAMPDIVLEQVDGGMLGAGGCLGIPAGTPIVRTLAPADSLTNQYQWVVPALPLGPLQAFAVLDSLRTDPLALSVRTLPADSLAARRAAAVSPPASAR